MLSCVMMSLYVIISSRVIMTSHAIKSSHVMMSKIVAEGDLYYSPMPFIAILNVCCSPNPLQERSFLPNPLRGNSFPEVDWESGKTHRGAVTRLGEQ